MLNHALLFEIPWTIARQVPLSMGFPRQEHWCELPSPGDLPKPGVEPAFSALQADSLMLHPKHRIRVTDKKEKPRTHNHRLLSAQSCSDPSVFTFSYLMDTPKKPVPAAGGLFHTPGFHRYQSHYISKDQSPLSCSPRLFFSFKKGASGCQLQIGTYQEHCQDWTTKAFAICLYGDWSPCCCKCWPSTTPREFRVEWGALCSRESGVTGL